MAGSRDSALTDPMKSDGQHPELLPDEYLQSFAEGRVGGGVLAARVVEVAFRVEALNLRRGLRETRDEGRPLALGHAEHPLRLRDQVGRDRPRGMVVRSDAEA